MDKCYYLYRWTGSLLFYAAVPLIWLYQFFGGFVPESLFRRLGFFPKQRSGSGRPGIWIHAASVGEVGAAVPIVNALFKSLGNPEITFSTFTRHGQHYARKKLAQKVNCIYAPLDFVASIRRYLRYVKPDVMVFMETEIWPNWIVEARNLRIPIIIVNGRISKKSIKKYLKIKSVILPILQNIEMFSMAGIEDAKRISLLGSLNNRIVVNGNTKFDLPIDPGDLGIQHRYRRIYGLDGTEPVFIAGSTRSGEEEMIIDAYRKIIEKKPDTILIIAPRHIERTRHIERMLKINRIDYQLKTDLEAPKSHRSCRVIILNKIGELQETYSIATVVFCGGSLVPLGGQNIIEPAAWGKPVLYGPFMDDFIDAEILLERFGGSVPVKNGNDLAQNVTRLLTHPDEARRIGQLARSAVETNTGAAEKHARLICRLIPGFEAAHTADSKR